MLEKSILLIGGNGFLGSNIMNWIDDHFTNYKVSTINRTLRRKDEQKFECLGHEFVGDFTDEQFLKEIFSNYSFDYVFHCLSTSIPATSNHNIIADVQTNLIATINLLDLLKDKKSTLIFFSSGGAIYGNSSSTVHKVGDNPYPISSYGVIKNSIEQYIHIYHRLYELQYLILRISNPYGPYHKSNVQGVINIAIRKAIAKEVIEVWGTGENLKDYIFSQDIPEIIFALLANNIVNSTINLGSGEGNSINSILNIINEFDPGLEIKYIEQKKHDVAEFVLDIVELKGLIDITLTPLKEGILKTYTWQKSNLIAGF